MTNVRFTVEVCDQKKFKKVSNDLHIDKQGLFCVNLLTVDYYWSCRYDTLEAAVISKIIAEKIEDFLEDKDYSIVTINGKDYFLVNNLNRDAFFGDDNEDLVFSLDDLRNQGVIEIEY